MTILVPMIPLFLLLTALVVFFIVISRHRSKGSRGPKKKKPLGNDSAAILREANKRLSQNPRDAEALLALAEVHYGIGEYEKSMKEYEILIGLCATNPSLDQYDVTVKYALSALNSNREEEAYGSLLIAHSIKADGSFYPVLEEGTPGRKRVILTTVKDNQGGAQIDLYRGGGRHRNFRCYLHRYPRSR